MIKVHNLKIEKRHYTSIINGIKHYELRLNDRDYQVGDFINFRVIEERSPYVDADGNPVEYLAETPTLYEIRSILSDYQGLEKGYCILGIYYWGAIR